MNSFASSYRTSLPRSYGEADSFYFSYGSNLHLAQMAHRCPKSIFRGKATLPGYRWQINERGVANVVESTHSSVEGLLYHVNPKDERALDRAEGVAKGFYQKHLLKVILEPHPQYSGFITSQLSQVLAQQGVSEGQSSDLTLQPSTENPWESNPTSLVYQNASISNERHDEQQEQAYRTKQVKALVYISEKYTTDGAIRDEYISRMQKAAYDAILLGVSHAFVNKYIVPFLGSGSVLPAAPRTIFWEGQATNQRETDNNMTFQDVSGDLESYRTGANENNELDVQHSQTYHTATNSSEQVDLYTLKQENREVHSDSGLTFPVQMLDGLMEMGSMTSGDRNMIYIVLKHIITSSNPRLNIEATTQDLELANELAMKHFRDAYSRNSRLQAEPFGCRYLEWDLDENNCLNIGADIPESESRVKVWVYPQVILRSS